MRAWMQSARARDHVGVQLIPPGLDIAALRFKTYDPDSQRAPEPLADVSDEAPAALSLEDIRRQGGPSLDQLRSRIEEKSANGDLESAAALFNSLPGDLRRPVEILGLLHLFTRLGAHTDPDQREAVSAVRPDGSTRTFLMPSATIQPAGDTKDNNTEGAHQ